MSLKILHCVSSLQVGGAEKCAVNLLTYQKSQGHTVAALSFGNPSEPFQGVLEKREIKVFNNTGGIIKRLLETVKILKRFDIIHIHSPSVVRAFLPIFPVLLHKKVLYTHHGEDSPPQRGMRLSHWIGKFYIDQDFAVSAKVKDSVARRYNWNPDNTYVIQNGVIVNQAPVTAPGKPFKFACVARMVPLKQLDKVVDAFAKAGLQDSCELHLFGDGPERAKIESRISLHYLDNAVTLHGNVLDEDAIYNDVDCLIINSTTEGLPMALLESLARGRPAISTRVGEIPKLDEQAQFCWFVDDDTDDLANTMKSVVMDPEKWTYRAQNGRHLVMLSYSIEQVSRTYLMAVR